MSDCMRTDPTVSFVAMIELACAMIKLQNYELIAAVDEGDDRVLLELGQPGKISSRSFQILRLGVSRSLLVLAFPLRWILSPLIPKVKLEDAWAGSK